MRSPTTTTVEEVMEKIRNLEKGHTYLREEMAFLKIWAQGSPPRLALQGSDTSTKSVVKDGRSLGDLLMEGYYMNILDSMGQAVFAYNLDRRVFYWNQHSERLFDCSREDALGKDILSILVNPDLYGTVLGVINGVKQGASWTGQFPVELQMGKKILAITSVDPFYDDEATLVGIVVIAVDATPFFEIKYSVPQIKYVDLGQNPCPSTTILKSKLGLNPKQTLQTAIASKLTTLATKVSNKVRSKMKIGERYESATGPSRDDSRFSIHDDKDCNEEGEGKSGVCKITSKIEAWIQEKA